MASVPQGTTAERGRRSKHSLGSTPRVQGEHRAPVSVRQPVDRGPGGGNRGDKEFDRRGSGRPQSQSAQGGSNPAWRDHRPWWGDRDHDGDRDGHHHGKGFRHHDRDFVFLSFGFGFRWPWYNYYSPYWPSYSSPYRYNYYPYEPYYYPYEPYSYYPSEPYSYSSGYGTGSQDPLALGSQYFAQGDYLQARDSLLKAMVAQPDNPKARFAYGQALLALGQYQSAAEAIRQGLALDLSWPEVQMDLRSAYGDPSEFARQLGKLESYLAAHPEDADARFLRAYNLYFSGQKDRAREEFSKLAQANPLDKAPELFLDSLSDTSGPATSRPGGAGPVTPNTPAPQAGPSGSARAY